MIPRKYLELLACPKCYGGLEETGEELVCQSCSAKYPVKEGIPILLIKEELDASTRTSADSWDQFWDHWGMHKEGDVDRHPYYSKVLQHIHAHAPEGDWGVFLELGCGNGALSFGVARSRKIPVVGIDFSFGACRGAKKYFEQEGVEGFFVVGDIQRLPFTEKVFGYIFAGGSLEHFTDTFIGVQEAYRVCTTGGKIFASVPGISLTTLIVYQSWGNIPELPLIRPLAEWLHIKILKSKHMKYGYEKSFTHRGFAKYFAKAGFKDFQFGLFDYNREMRLLPFAWMKRLANRIMRLRLFWPMFYLEAARSAKQASGE